VLRAEHPVVIKRGGTTPQNYAFFTAQNLRTLTLGKEVDTANYITIDGGGSAVTSTFALIMVAGTFTMYDGKITNNVGTNSANGGGVTVSMNGSFTMKGGRIQGNYVTASGGKGGQVYVNATSDPSSPTFNMEGGIISNEGSSETSQAVYGAGVCIKGETATFNKTGGIIYGSNGPPGFALNADMAGDAVYYENNDSSITKKRDDTLEDGVHLSVILGVIDVPNNWE
jgi:hypothetical protein